MRINFMKKAVNLRFIVLTVIAIVLAISIIAGAVYYYSGSLFSGGTFNNTLYNSTEQYIYLNYTDATNTSYVTNGTYISSIIDFGINATFVQLKWKGYQRSCPANMSYIDKFGGYCIDMYEASRPDATSVSAGSDSTHNATSKPNVLPWAAVTQLVARTACANALKHLCTSEEWLGAVNIKGVVYNLPTGAGSATRIPSVSTDSSACNTYSQCAPCQTGSHLDCVSSENVYDMIGNVAEWVNETVTTINPCSGSSSYCYINNTRGWQTGTANTNKYGSDGVYFLAGVSTGRAVYRGGKWVSGADAGPFYAGVIYDASSSDGSIGFRCCSSVL